MEIFSSTPLLELEHADGVIRHPFPLNCFMKHWYLGSDFYHSVKIGIVQYVWFHFFMIFWAYYCFLNPTSIN